MNVVGRMLQLLIRGYQLFISPVLPRSCRYEPSCSAYAMQAIGRFGPLKGGWLAIKRIGSCHPWGGMGYDPVPEASDHVEDSKRHVCHHGHHG